MKGYNLTFHRAAKTTSALPCSLTTAYSFSRYVPVVAEVMNRQADESDDLTAGLLPVVCDDRQR